MTSNKDIVRQAVYIIENKCTLRQAAKHFGVSKSTIHRNMRHNLMYCDYELYLEVADRLKTNKELGPLRGGYSTKKYWEAIRKCSKNLM